MHNMIVLPPNFISEWASAVEVFRDSISSTLSRHALIMPARSTHDDLPAAAISDDEIDYPGQWALASERVLARDWLAPGEDEAWQDL